jgi:hypothetical protein
MLMEVAMAGLIAWASFRLAVKSRSDWDAGWLDFGVGVLWSGVTVLGIVVYFVRGEQ